MPAAAGGRARTSPTCCEQVPGAFVFVSATPARRGPRTAPYNHSAQARFSDDALVTGPALLAALALDRLADAAVG